MSKPIELRLVVLPEVDRVEDIPQRLTVLNQSTIFNLVHVTEQPNLPEH